MTTYNNLKDILEKLYPNIKYDFKLEGEYYILLYLYHNNNKFEIPIKIQDKDRLFLYNKIKNEVSLFFSIYNTNWYNGLTDSEKTSYNKLKKLINEK